MARLTHISHQGTSTGWKINRGYEQERGYLKQFCCDIRVYPFKSQNKTLLLELLTSWYKHTASNHAALSYRRSVPLTLALSDAYLSSNYIGLHPFISNTNIFLQHKNFIPKLYVAYIYIYIYIASWAHIRVASPYSTNLYNIFYSLTYSLHGVGCCLKSWMSLSSSKKSYFLYGTRRFINVFTKARHWTLY